jgi:membrane protease YdiL (CAAX protease family)
MRQEQCSAAPLIAASIAISIVGVASGETPPGKNALDTNPEQYLQSLQLKHPQEYSVAAKSPNEHCSAANLLFYQKRFEDAAYEYQKCVLLEPANFDAHLWLAYSFYELRRYDDAASSLKKALELKPNDFNASHWRGVTLLRAGRFEEAIHNLETANEVKKDDKPTRRELFLAYSINGQYGKAFRLFPLFVTIAGSALILVYIVGIAVLFSYSLKIRPVSSPGLGFSLAWIGIFGEGQIALVVILGLFSWMKINENPLAGVILAGLPVIAAAAIGFARQPWGEPFRWRLGPERVIWLSSLLLFLSLVFNGAFAILLTQITHKSPPIQESVPLIQYALRSNPVIAVLTMVVVAPIVEEVLFRGLAYGALEKRLGAGAAILGSSLLFALFHLQVLAFVPLFCLGLVLCWARWKCGSIALPILLHAFNNGLATFLLKVSEHGA